MDTQRITTLETHREHDSAMLKDLDERMKTVESMVADIHRGFRALIVVANAFKWIAGLGAAVVIVWKTGDWSEVAKYFR